MQRTPTRPSLPRDHGSLQEQPAGAAGPRWREARRAGRRLAPRRARAAPAQRRVGGRAHEGGPGAPGPGAAGGRIVGQQASRDWLSHGRLCAGRGQWGKPRAAAALTWLCGRGSSLNPAVPGCSAGPQRCQDVAQYFTTKMGGHASPTRRRRRLASSCGARRAAWPLCCPWRRRPSPAAPAARSTLASPRLWT
jgi:hypothetical protein